MIKQLLEIVGAVVNHEPVYGINARGYGKNVRYIYIPSTPELDAGFYSVCAGKLVAYGQ